MNRLNSRKPILEWTESVPGKNNQIFLGFSSTNTLTLLGFYRLTEELMNSNLTQLHQNLVSFGH